MAWPSVAFVLRQAGVVRDGYCALGAAEIASANVHTQDPHWVIGLRPGQGPLMVW